MASSTWPPQDELQRHALREAFPNNPSGESRPEPSADDEAAWETVEPAADELLDADFLVLDDDWLLDAFEEEPEEPYVPYVPGLDGELGEYDF